MPANVIDQSGFCACCGSPCGGCCCVCGPAPGLACITFSGVQAWQSYTGFDANGNFGTFLGPPTDIGTVSVPIWLSIGPPLPPPAIPFSVEGFQVGAASGNLPDQTIYPVYASVGCRTTTIGDARIDLDIGGIALSGVETFPDPRIGRGQGDGTMNCGAGTGVFGPSSLFGQLAAGQPYPPSVAYLTWSSATITQGACLAGETIDCTQIDPLGIGHTSARTNCLNCDRAPCRCVCGIVAAPMVQIAAGVWQGPATGGGNCPPGMTGTAILTCSGGAMSLAMSFVAANPLDNFTLTTAQVLGVVYVAFNFAATFYLLMNVNGGPCDGKQILATIGL